MLTKLLKRIISKVSSVWLGLTALSLVLYFGVFHGFPDLGLFFNEHALILVFGGTLAVALMSYPMGSFLEMGDFLFYGFLLKEKNDLVLNVRNFLIGAHQIKVEGRNVNTLTFQHLFSKDALRLVADGHYSIEDTHAILSAVRESFHKRYNEQAKILSNLSKFPPALGLLGASTGMIKMMMNLGNGGAAAIGAAMAIALTATFWGIGVANFVLLPLADYAFGLAEKDLYFRGIIIDGALQLKQGVSFSTVAEAVCGRLPVAERFEVLNDLKIYREQALNSNPASNLTPLRTKSQG